MDSLFFLCGGKIINDDIHMGDVYKDHYNKED